MARRPGLSARLKLTLSYAGFILLTGALLLAVVWVFLLRYVPEPPGRSRPRRARVPAHRPEPLRPAGRLRPPRRHRPGLPARVRPAGRMDPRRPDARATDRIADAARMAADGSLSHRIRMEGPKDEFRELADVFDTMLEELEPTSPSSSGSPRTPPTNCAPRWRSRRPSSTSPATTRHGTRASSSNASTPSMRGRSTSPRPSCCSAEATAGTSPASPSTSPSSPKRPPRRCFPSPSSAGSRSRSPARRLRPSAPRCSWCGW